MLKRFSFQQQQQKKTNSFQKLGTQTRENPETVKEEPITQW